MSFFKQEILLSNRWMCCGIGQLVHEPIRRTEMGPLVIVRPMNLQKSRLPKLRSQPQFLENFLHLVHCPAMIFGRHAIVIPTLREFPQLWEGDYRATFGFARDKPFVQCFFRPEEKHIRSSEGKIVIPLPKRDKEMHSCVRLLDLSIRHT